MNHNKVVKVNLIFVFVMAISGLGFGFFTGSKSIITDGIVSSVIFVSAYVGTFVHMSLEPAPAEEYPYGKWRFEYVYNFLRMITLLAIIGYSFLESIYTIFHYYTSGVYPKEVILSQVMPYFVIKTLMVICSLLWLKRCYKRKNVSLEAYKMEKNSVQVDGILTLAIFAGIVVFSHIKVISDVADAFTLLVVAIILGISVFKELRQLVDMMVGKRIFHKEEELIIDLAQKKYDDFYIHNVFVEKHGVLTMIYAQCSYNGELSSEQFTKIQNELKASLIAVGIERPMIHFYFEDNQE